MAKIKAAGKYRIEGKQYIVQVGAWVGAWVGVRVRGWVRPLPSL
jgi:hypothetical protein